MLIVLIASSAIAFAGEKLFKRGRYSASRVALALAIALGLVFVALSLFDYHQHLQDLLPTEDAYGSIFYTIITFHFAHLVLGLAMLLWVLIQPRLASSKPPHHALHNATMYWHFVDLIWVVIVFLMFFIPNWRT
jgi:heme/copper-type cytochrome/quinol oxidase subunit 3